MKKYLYLGIAFVILVCSFYYVGSSVIAEPVAEAVGCHCRRVSGGRNHIPGPFDAAAVDKAV